MSFWEFIGAIDVIFFGAACVLGIAKIADLQQQVAELKKDIAVLNTRLQNCLETKDIHVDLTDAPDSP